MLLLLSLQPNVDSMAATINTTAEWQEASSVDEAIKGINAQEEGKQGSGSMCWSCITG